MTTKQDYLERALREVDASPELSAMMHEAQLRLSLAAALQKAIDRSGKTITAIAKEMGTSRAHVSSTLSGDISTSLTLHTLFKLALTFKCRVWMGFESLPEISHKKRKAAT